MPLCGKVCSGRCGICAGHPNSSLPERYPRLRLTPFGIAGIVAFWLASRSRLLAREWGAEEIAPCWTASRDWLRLGPPAAHAADAMISATSPKGLDENDAWESRPSSSIDIWSIGPAADDCHLSDRGGGTYGQS